MKSIIRTLAVIGFVFIAWSCTVYELETKSLQTFDTFYADFQDNAVKSTVFPNGSVQWDDYDKIVVFSDTQPEGVIYERQGGNCFRGEPISGNVFYAYHSYSEFYQPICQDESNPFLLHVQSLSIDSSNYLSNVPMVAKSNDNNLSFKQTTAILHFSITGSGHFNQVVLTCNGTERIWGDGDIDLREEIPIFKLGETVYNDSYQLKLYYAQEVLQDGCAEVFFPIPVQTLKKGFTFELRGVNMETGDISTLLLKVSSKELNAKRGEMYSYKVDTSEMQEEEVVCQRDILEAFYRATNGDDWTDNTNWCSDMPIDQWRGIRTSPDGRVVDINLQNNHLTGVLPSVLVGLTDLQTLSLHGNEIGGTLPPELAEMRSLFYLNVTSNQIEGEIPSNYPGYIKESWLENNYLSGTIPAAYLDSPEWNEGLWQQIMGKNLYSLADYPVYPCSYSATDIDGNVFDTMEECGKNVYTAFLVWGTWCPVSEYYMPVMLEAFDAFKSKGFEVISCAFENTEDTEPLVRECISRFSIPWRTYITTNVNNAKPKLFAASETPSICILDNSGRMVYSTEVNDERSAIYEWLCQKLGEDPAENMYVSTDYSRNGAVSLLQGATAGNGINLVLMGDGYSDRQIASGQYAAEMAKVADAFFSIEPYRSFRDLFNVYSVEVVSKNEGYLHGSQTALGGSFNGIRVSGNFDAINQYASRAVNGSLDDVLVVVLMNRDYYAGICHMFVGMESDYGSGEGISMFPAISDEKAFNYLVRHEMGGHGFAKLADEYSYLINEYLDAWQIEEYNAQKLRYGWWKNTDFVNDPLSVSWSRFISDSRYDSEMIGVYEGAFSYMHGAWRPTEDSIMNENRLESYNAPSRYAIWYRINKLAYGPEWNGSYEDFVEYDAINRQQASPSGQANAKHLSYVEKKLPPLAPPVVVRGSWRDVK